jgi:hypothetical protein
LAADLAVAPSVGAVGSKGGADRVARRQALAALLGEFLLVFLREDNLARLAAEPAGPVLGALSAAVGVAVPGSVA